MKKYLKLIFLFVFSILFLQSCAEKKVTDSSKEEIVKSLDSYDKLLQNIDPKVKNSRSSDTDKIPNIFVSVKEGVWLKATANIEVNEVFVEFNEELIPLKEGFVKEGNSLGRRWLLVKTTKGIGWIKSGNYGEKWCPEDLDVTSLSNEFVERLKQNKSLSNLMSDKWSFVYHEDNRSDGSTDGFLHNLDKNLIDEKLNFKVINDGDGWVDKKEKNTYKMSFSLKETIAEWNRIEVAPYNNPCEKIVYILGNGESDYLKLHLTKVKTTYLITKLKYGSEDPG